MSRLSIRTKSEAQALVDSMYAGMERRIVSSPNGLCPIDITLNFVRLCQAQSCGKCTPCRIGLGKLAALLEQVLDGKADYGTLDIIKETAANIVDSADCAIGFNAAQLVLNGMAGFEDDFKGFSGWLNQQMNMIRHNDIFVYRNGRISFRQRFYDFLNDHSHLRQLCCGRFVKRPYRNLR